MLTTRSGEQPPVLQHARLAAQVNTPLLQVTAEQHYRNESQQTLEVVYSFPVPTGAALLGLEFELAGRKLSGQVKARREASADYDRAIEAGDTAVLVEQQRDGLYTANLGNLKPGERAVIRLTYGSLLTAQDDDWRIPIPTVLAPFYGDAAGDGGLDPRAAPTQSVAAEYPLELTLQTPGSDPAALRCTSHAAKVTVENGVLHAQLADDVRLDRDVVFLLKRASALQTAAAADGDRAVVVASTVLDARDAAHRPASVRLVLDCSGSMAGDSMDWAAVGCQNLIKELSDGDELSVTRFGSNVQHLTRRMVKASDRNRQTYARQLMDVVADLGGTEMEKALKAAAQLKGSQARSEIVLLTDGEIWASDALVRWARASGLRCFVIGVGAAPNHTFLQRLANETGGSCDFVTPGEDMLAAVQRVLARLHAPRRETLDIVWPTPPAWTLQLPPVAHAGQAVHVIAGFEALPSGSVTIEQRSCSMPADEVAGDALSRVVAYQRLLSGHFEDPAATAERYQLVTEWTHLVAVLERATDDKAEGLPQIANVDHMLAAGWGGVGRAGTDISLNLAFASGSPSAVRRQVDSFIDTSAAYSRPGSAFRFEDLISDDRRDVPRMVAEEEPVIPPEVRRVIGFADRGDQLAPIVRGINRRIVMVANSGTSALTLDWIAPALPGPLVAALRSELDRPMDEADLVLAFLELLQQVMVFGDTQLSEHSHGWIAARRADMRAASPQAREAAERAFDSFFFGATPAAEADANKTAA